MAGLFTPEMLQRDFFCILKAQIQFGAAFAAAHPQIEAFSESFLKERGKPIFEEALFRFNFDENAGLHRLIAAAFEKGEFRAGLPLHFIQMTIRYLLTHSADLTAMSGVENAEENLLLLLEFLKYSLARPED